MDNDHVRMHLPSYTPASTEISAEISAGEKPSPKSSPKSKSMDKLPSEKVETAQKTDQIALTSDKMKIPELSSFDDTRKRLSVPSASSLDKAEEQEMGIKIANLRSPDQEDIFPKNQEDNFPLKEDVFSWFEDTETDKFDKSLIRTYTKIRSILTKAIADGQIENVDQIIGLQKNSKHKIALKFAIVDILKGNQLDKAIEDGKIDIVKEIFVFSTDEKLKFSRTTLIKLVNAGVTFDTRDEKELTAVKKALLLLAAAEPGEKERETGSLTALAKLVADTRINLRNSKKDLEKMNALINENINANVIVERLWEAIMTRGGKFELLDINKDSILRLVAECLNCLVPTIRDIPLIESEYPQKKVQLWKIKNMMLTLIRVGVDPKCLHVLKQDWLLDAVLEALSKPVKGELSASAKELMNVGLKLIKAYPSHGSLKRKNALGKAMFEITKPHEQDKIKRELIEAGVDSHVLISDHETHANQRSPLKSDVTKI